MTDKTATAEAVAPNPYCADGCGSRVNSPKATFRQGHDQRLISDLSSRVVDGEMGPFQRGLLGLVDNPKTTVADEFYYGETDDIQHRINTINAAIAYRFSVGLAGKFTSAAMAKWEKHGRKTAREQAKLERAKERAAKTPTKAAATKTVLRHLNEADENGRPLGASFTLDDRDDFWAAVAAHLTAEVGAETLKAADSDAIYQVFASGLAAAEQPPAKITGSGKTVGQPVKNLRGTKVKVKIGRWTYDATVVGMNQAGKVTAVEYIDKKGEEKTTDRFKLVD